MNHLRFILVGTLLIAMFSIQAQKRLGFPDVEKMHQNKWEFITKEVQFTPQEEQSVKVVFMDYEKSVWNLHKQVHDLFHRAKGKKISEMEYKELNDKIINVQIKETQYLRMYHLKLRKLLNPEKLFNYYRAERKFKLQLLYKRPPRPPRNNE